MAILELLARAETSSDLEHHTHDCHVDVIGAAGLAALHTPSHFALYRLKYLNDTQALPVAKAVFIRWTHRAMTNRKAEPQGASRFGTQILAGWLNDVCHVCNGRKHQLAPGAPVLTVKLCGTCNGSGKPQMIERGARAEVVRDVTERADSAVLWIQRTMDEKLGRRE